MTHYEVFQKTIQTQQTEFRSCFRKIRAILRFLRSLELKFPLAFTPLCNVVEGSNTVWVFFMYRQTNAESFIKIGAPRYNLCHIVEKLALKKWMRFRWQKCRVLNKNLFWKIVFISYFLVHFITSLKATEFYYW